MKIQSETAEWDGKSADDIRRIFEKYQSMPQYADNLLELLDYPFTQRGASWQLKAHLESGGTLTENQVIRLISQLKLLEHWESKLHILQIFPRLNLSAQADAEIKNFLDTCLNEKNKFVRAWAYTGLHRLANYFPEYQQEAFERLNQAMETESGSIKVRVRKALAEGF